MSTYIRLIRYLYPHIRIFWVAVVCMFVSTLLNGLQTGSLVVIFDRIVTDQGIPVPAGLPVWLTAWLQWLNSVARLDLVFAVALALPVLFFIKGLFTFLYSFLMGDTAQRVIRDLRQSIFDRYMELSLDYHGRGDTGTRMARIMNDAGVIQNTITEGCIDLIFQGFNTLMYLSIVLVIDWKSALVIFGVVPVIALPVAMIGRRLKKLSHQGQTAVGQLTRSIYEGLAGIRVVHAFLVEKHMKDKFKFANWQAYRVQRRSEKRMKTLSPLTEFIGACVGAFFFWYYSRRVILGTMSIGQCTVFLAAMLQMIHPLKRISRLHGTIQQALAAAERVFEVLDEPASVADAADAEALRPFSHHIRFEHVSFHYEKSKPVLRDISLTVPLGETVALVGPSGGGKSTLVNLLPRFFDPASGRVTIDGTDIRHATLSSLREQIGLVTQETFLFNDTVYANIALGRPNVSQAEIERAAKLANAHGFILKLPKGYDTVIGERGDLLSGGERQRLSVARAFLKNPPILILDEATSQLDAESEHLISDALSRLTQGRTVLLIAHRLSSIRLAQRILVLQEGRIVEQGSHDELLKKSPLYRRFCELQLIHTGDADSSS